MRRLMEQIKVLVLSSVVPNAFGSGGELVLHRHLKLNPRIDSRVIFWERFPLRLKVIGKLREVGFRPVSQSWECMFPVLPSHKIIADQINSFRPHVLVTVAHGWWHMQARRIASQFRLPLVCLFQDWWPDFPGIPSAFRARVEHQFRKTCAESDIAICVSHEMRRELGDPGNALVLHDTPSLPQSLLPAPDTKLPLRVAYFGNLSEYGPLVESAVRALNGSDKIRLEVFGPNPLWTSTVRDEFRSRGIYRGFLAQKELAQALLDFQAALVVMSFAPSLSRRMKTSFPSKMIDATQLGLPIIIWGPEECSAVNWARKGERALCVTDPDPSAIRSALEELAASPAEQQRLAQSSREAGATDFNPERIQAQFIEALTQAIQMNRIAKITAC
jgi:glycosyltransferase involved in cell wall biosynthesis